MKKTFCFAALLVAVGMTTLGYSDDCPNGQRMLKAAVKFEQVVEEFSTMARSGRIESRQSMYGSSTTKVDALRADARKMTLVARALTGSAEDRVMLKRAEGNDISSILRGCEFPAKDLARLREDFDTMSTEIGRELTPQRTSLKRFWREVEEVYRAFEEAIRP